MRTSHGRRRLWSYDIDIDIGEPAARTRIHEPTKSCASRSWNLFIMQQRPVAVRPGACTGMYYTEDIHYNLRTVSVCICNRNQMCVGGRLGASALGSRL